MGGSEGQAVLGLRRTRQRWGRSVGARAFSLLCFLNIVMDSKKKKKKAKSNGAGRKAAELVASRLRRCLIKGAVIVAEEPS